MNEFCDFIGFIRVVESLYDSELCLIPLRRLCYLSGTGKTVVAGNAEYFYELQAKEPTVDGTDLLYEQVDKKSLILFILQVTDLLLGIQAIIMTSSSHFFEHYGN